MAISINYPDKILAGVWQSYTLTSDEGPPEGEVVLDGKPVERRFISMRRPLWKVTFFLPPHSAGKIMTLKFHNGASQIEESKAIEAG